MTRTSLPPGFRFHPTDVELVKYYLKKKVLGKRIKFEVMSEVDIYKFAPRDLPDKSCLRSKDLEWYFYCPREKKYANGGRMNRATECGYWKTTGKDRSILHNQHTVGMIKTLIFHTGRAPRGDRTDWVMHEYRLEDANLVDAGVVQDTYVLCKIFQKSGPGPRNGAQYGAPFNEEEWSDDENEGEVSFAVPFPSASLSAPAPEFQPNQNSSVTRMPVPETTCNGSSSVAGPSSSVQLLDKILQSDPADNVSNLEIPLSPNDDIFTMLDLTDDMTLVGSDADKNENLDQIDHGGIFQAAFLDGFDIFNDLPDIGKCPELSDDGLNSSVHKAGFATNQMFTCDEGSYLELNDLDSPLKRNPNTYGSERTQTDILPLDYNLYKSSEQQPYYCPVTYFDAGQLVCASSQPSLLPEGSYGYDGNFYAFQKDDGVKEYANQAYQEYVATPYNTDVTVWKQPELGGVKDYSNHPYQEYEATPNIADVAMWRQPELDGRYVSQAQTRGVQQRQYYSRLQQLLESIPAHPAFATEHKASITGVKESLGFLFSPYYASSIHVKAEVTVGRCRCTKDALSDKLGEIPYICCHYSQLRKLFRKKAVTSGCRFSFVIIMWLMSVLVWIFIAVLVLALSLQVCVEPSPFLTCFVYSLNHNCGSQILTPCEPSHFALLDSVYIVIFNVVCISHKKKKKKKKKKIEVCVQVNVCCARFDCIILICSCICLDRQKLTSLTVGIVLGFVFMLE